MDQRMEQWAIQVKKGVLQLCLMALLKGKEVYGYQLTSEMEKRSGGGMMLSEGTVYPLLRRMEREGLVASRWKESDSGPPRRYYTLTENGVKMHDEMLKEWGRYIAACQKILEMV